MKFDLRRSLCGVFGAEMVQKLGIPPVDVVTYIPTAPRRVRERGFDHARIIARSAAKQGNLPFKRLLERTSSIRQVGAGRALRLRQMNNVFEVADPQHVKGKQILLVDDVVTTGATIESAAAVLRSAGARRVYVYAISLHYS